MRKFLSAVRADPLAGTVAILSIVTPLCLVASLVVRFTASDTAWRALFIIAVVSAASAAVLAAMHKRRGRTR